MLRSARVSPGEDDGGREEGEGGQEWAGKYIVGAVRGAMCAGWGRGQAGIINCYIELGARGQDEPQQWIKA